jgi:hypothetical protein
VHDVERRKLATLDVECNGAVLLEVRAEPVLPPPLVVKDYLIGYRAWFSAHGVLASIGVTPLHWQPGVNQAHCARKVEGETEHVAPVVTCDCGFYVAKSLAKALRQTADPSAVYGAVKAWGRAIEHGADGFRIEYAEVLALLGKGGDVSALPREPGAVATLAAKYGVPVLEAEALVRYASEFGVTP